MKNNKAQMNQVFTIIFALLMMVLIVYFASKGIGGLLGDKCNADYASFINDLDEVLEDGKNYGAILKHRLSAPCDFHQLCFTSASATATTTNIDDLIEYDDLATVMEKSVADSSNNVFLYDGKEVKLINYYDTITVSNDEEFICIQRKAGRFNFITEGKGKTIEILPETMTENTE